MATKKRKTKNSDSETATKTKTKEKLDVATVVVAPAKVPPSQRLFPSSLLAELDELKSRLEAVERVLNITK